MQHGTDRRLDLEEKRIQPHKEDRLLTAEERKQIISAFEALANRLATVRSED